MNWFYFFVPLSADTLWTTNKLLHPHSSLFHHLFLPPRVFMICLPWYELTYFSSSAFFHPHPPAPAFLRAVNSSRGDLFSVSVRTETPPSSGFHSFLLTLPVLFLQVVCQEVPEGASLLLLFFSFLPFFFLSLPLIRVLPPPLHPPPPPPFSSVSHLNLMGFLGLNYSL